MVIASTLYNQLTPVEEIFKVHECLKQQGECQTYPKVYQVQYERVKE